MAEKGVNTRDLVLDILLQVTRDGVFSHVALSGVLDKYRYLPRRDRAFITRLSEGTIERMIELDYILDQYSRTPVKKMKPVIRCILRMGVYQIRYMDQVPDRAACDEAVNLAIRHGFRGLKGFVNGVMRSIARNQAKVTMPDPEKEPDAFFSVRYSMPLWLVKRFRGQYGDSQCRKILEAFLQPRPLTIRVNTMKTDAARLAGDLQKEGVGVQFLQEQPEALCIHGMDSLEALETFQNGLFYVQDLSSMLPLDLAALSEGMEVLDMCAAPGGKTIQAACRMRGTGRVISRDVSANKIQLIRDNVQRAGLANVSVQQWDARTFDDSLLEKEDLVIADLPCSGLGVIGRKPDIKYNVTEEAIRSLSGLQQEILTTACRYVKPGGSLAYSTCTLTEEENQANVRTFLKAHPEFSLTQEKTQLPETWCDGFYVAILKKSRTSDVQTGAAQCR